MWQRELFVAEIGGHDLKQRGCVFCRCCQGPGRLKVEAGPCGEILDRSLEIPVVGIHAWEGFGVFVDMYGCTQ